MLLNFFIYFSLSFSLTVEIQPLNTMKTTIRQPIFIHLIREVSDVARSPDVHWLPAAPLRQPHDENYISNIVNISQRCPQIGDQVDAIK